MCIGLCLPGLGEGADSAPLNTPLSLSSCQPANNKADCMVHNGQLDQVACGL